jgi:hypothetical protein
MEDKLKETAVELYKNSFRGYWCEVDDKCSNQCEYCRYEK